MEKNSGVDALVKLGLGGNSAKVYAALAEAGEATAEQLANSTGVHRRSVYDALTELINNGLASVSFESGGKAFSTTGAHVLEEWIDGNRARACSFIRKAEEQRRTRLPRPVVRAFFGKEGIKAVLADGLNVGKTIYWYGGSHQGGRIFLKGYYPIWNAKRVRLKIPIKMIFIDKPEVKEFIAGERLFEARSIPEKLFSNVVWWLYGNKMAMVFWRDDPFAIVMEDEDLATTYRNFFNLIWKAAKPFKTSG